MELRHLRYFLAVAEELNFTRAAERLRVAQPSLSQQIRDLERELGISLFHRTKRHVELTTAGAFLVSEAREIVHRAEQAATDARQVASGQAGRIRIGYVQSAIYDILPTVLNAFTDRYPAVDVELSWPGLTPTHVDALETGAIDAAFLRPPVRSSVLRTMPVKTEGFVVALPERHPLARGGDMAVGELARESFVTLPVREGSVLVAETILLCQRSGFRPRIRQEAAELDTVVRLVAAGLGVALVPSSIAAIAVPGLAWRHLSGRVPRLQTCLAWRAANQSPVLREFVELVRTLLPNVNT